MKITLISPALPPALDGIGDYSAFLSEELARQGHEVTVLTGTDFSPISGVRIQKWPPSDKGIFGVLPLIEADPPDWILLQYNPF